MNNLKVTGITLLLSLNIALAGTRYVRPGASGNNSGTDWNNAYSSLPTNLVRGDTYYLADGSYAGHTFKDNGAGLITLKKATVNDHGISTGWNNNYGDGQALFTGRLSFQMPYYKIDGQSRSSISSGHGIKVKTNGGYTIVSTSKYITLRYVDVENGGTTGPDGRCFHLTTGTPQNITISYCYIHDVNGVHFRTVNAHNLLVEHSYIARNESDPIMHAEMIADNNSDNVTFRHNIFEDIEGSGFIVMGNGSKYTGVEENWKIYGNVFYHTPGYNGGVSGILNILHGTALNWMFYNNSIVGIKGLHAGISNGGSIPGMVVKNNIWYGNRVNTIGGGGNRDYNWYYDNVRTGVGELDSKALSFEPNAQLGTGNPFVDIANRNFQLKKATLPGATLSSEYKFDMLGNIRGTDGLWDRGAFEYGITITAQPDFSFNQIQNNIDNYLIPNPIINLNIQAVPAGASVLNMYGQRINSAANMPGGVIFIIGNTGIRQVVNIIR